MLEPSSPSTLFRLKKTVFLALIAHTLALSGCGILIGNVKPVTEKSEKYSIQPPNQFNGDWIEVKATEQEPALKTKEDIEEEEINTSISDMAFQARSTASIISLNSSCRTRIEKSQSSLRDFTKLLLLGFSDVRYKEEKTINISGQPALQTTVSGLLNNQKMTVRTVVLKHQRCLFDLMYIARPKHFEIHEGDFGKFASSFTIQSES